MLRLGEGLLGGHHLVPLRLDVLGRVGLLGLSQRRLGRGVSILRLPDVLRRRGLLRLSERRLGRGHLLLRERAGLCGGGRQGLQRHLG